MTCVVAIKEPTQIIMASDSGSIDTDSMFIMKRADQKMIIRDNRFLIGFAGSYSHGQKVLTNYMPPQNVSMTPSKYMRTDFIDGLKELIDEKTMEASFLIGYSGELFWIQEDFQVAEITYDYMAIGSGYELALGSLFSTEGSTEFRLTTALRASMEFKAGIRPPFHMLRLPIESSL